MRNTNFGLSVAICVLACSLGGIGGANAQNLRRVSTTDIHIAPDLTVTETIHVEKTPLVESAVRAAAQSQLGTQGNQTFEVVEAFTRKADGRVVQAIPSDFVTQDGAVGAQMSYIDLKLQQIPFRDVSVGDTTVLTVRIVEREHYIPGQYSWSTLDAPSLVQRTIDVTLRAPSTLAISHDEEKFSYQESREGDEVVRHWAGKFDAQPNDEKNVADLVFAVPSLRFSTFANHEAIASAYHEQAKAKAAVTPEVQKLADESAQVLIGTEPVYRFAKTATLDAFNHVIVYIPALDRYVDPTVPFGNFARLPSGDAGKPVARVSDKGVAITKTPLPSVEDNVLEIDTRMVAKSDGHREGETRIEARGEFAESMRAFVAMAEAKGKDTMLASLAQLRGLTGDFDMDASAWTDNAEPFRITTRWKSPKPATAAEAALRVPPSFSPTIPTLETFFGAIDPKKRVFAAGCRAGRAVHTVHLTLPDNVTSIKLPPAVKKSTAQFTYTEEWSKSGRNIQRRTEIRSSVASRVCSPSQIDEIDTASRALQKRTDPVVYYAQAAPNAARPNLMQQFFGGGQQPAARPAQAAR